MFAKVQIQLSARTIIANVQALQNTNPMNARLENMRSL